MTKLCTYPPSPLLSSPNTPPPTSPKYCHFWSNKDPYNDKAPFIKPSNSTENLNFVRGNIVEGGRISVFL